MTAPRFKNKNIRRSLIGYLLLWQIMAIPLFYFNFNKNIFEVSRSHQKFYLSQNALFEVITIVKYDLKPNVLYKSNDPNFNGLLNRDKIIKPYKSLISILKSFSTTLLKNEQFFKPPPRSPPAYFS